jgi:hypothetical protein
MTMWLKWAAFPDAGRLFSFRNQPMRCYCMETFPIRLEARVAKSFDGSAPISEITSKSDIGILERAGISLHLNDEQRQCSDISEMIWSVSKLSANYPDYSSCMPAT